MKFKNVLIKGTGIYHPNNKVKNDFYIEHFKKQGKDITSFLEKLGVEERYIIDNENENALTMAVNSSKAALDNAGISADQLDAIIFSSDTPEYLCPSNALMINHELNAVNAHTMYDLNANCLGMLVGLDQISRFMKTSKKVRYALVVGSIYTSSIVRDDCKYEYPTTGDGSAAVILECKTEDFPRGFLDSNYFTRSEFYNTIVSPACGLTKARSNKVSEYDKKQVWVPFPFDLFTQIATDEVNSYMKEYNFTADDIQYISLSQYTKQFMLTTAKMLNMEDQQNKFLYTGNKYAYTGTTSPIFALHDGLQKEPGKRGQKLILCSMAAGIEACSILYEF